MFLRSALKSTSNKLDLSSDSPSLEYMMMAAKIFIFVFLRIFLRPTTNISVVDANENLGWISI
jgi:hypothetical protein